MLQQLRELASNRDFRKVFYIFLLAKAFVIAIAVGTQFFVPEEITHTEMITDNIFLNPFAQYDATAYLDIAENGYRADFGEYKAGNYHWYPLYPLLIRALGFMGYPLAAFIISNVASFLAVTMLYLLVREELGKRNAYKTLLYVVLFPTAFYFTMMYTESLFLFLSVAVFYFAKKGNWPIVGVVGFLVTLARMQGLLLLIPVGYIYLRNIKFNLRKINKNSLYFLGMPLGIAIFMFYEYLITGNPFIQFKSAVIFGKYLAWPWEGFLQAIRAIALDTTLINISYHIYNMVLTISFIVLLYVSYKKLKPEYTIYYSLSMLVILVSSNLFGITRYMLVAFPAFMALSLIDERNKYIKYGVAAAYVIFVLLAAGFVFLHATQRANLSILYTPLF